MTKLADAVDAINHYTGTDAETERILDLALPVMQLHAYRFHCVHPRFDADDLVANMQLFLLKYLNGKRPDVINQTYFSRLLYNQMITSVRCQYRDFRQKSKHLEYVNNCVINRINEYVRDDTMTDIRVTIDELNTSDKCKDILVKTLIEQYSLSDLLDYYNISLSSINGYYRYGMMALCERLHVEKHRWVTPVRRGKITRKPTGVYNNTTGVYNNRTRDERLIIADYESGIKFRLIAQKYKLKSRELSDILIRNGVTMRRTINKMKEQSIVRDYLNGMTYKDIAEKYCYNISTLPLVLKRNGIEPNRRGKKAA